ncbi:MAG: alpha/beta hydrolase [Hyphomonadaceae bacterium]|nr:alpha/beta hydrolase [Hyphomonadaceae bacterium]
MTLALTLLLAAPSCATAPRDMRFAEFDGHRIAYRMLGAGEPTIVMISGLGDGMATFDDVAPELAATATVILYDRPGYGGSAPTTGPRDAEAAERELSAVLDQSGARGPYVLIGHSLGGLYAEYFAAQHPDQIAGVVLEESRPADFTHRCEDAGVTSCTLPASMAWTLPAGGRAELASLPMTVGEVERIRTAHGKPVLVLSRPLSENPSAFDRLWSTAQRDLTARYPGARQLVAEDGGHYLHLDQRAWFVESVRAFINDDLAQR